MKYYIIVSCIITGNVLLIVVMWYVYYWLFHSQTKTKKVEEQYYKLEGIKNAYIKNAETLSNQEKIRNERLSKTA